MLTATHTRARGLADLPPVEPDSLLALIALCNADPRADKIDVGLGVFRDPEGRTPVLKVVPAGPNPLPPPPPPPPKPPPPPPPP